MNNIQNLFVDFINMTTNKRDAFFTVAKFVNCNVSKVKDYYDNKLNYHNDNFENKIKNVLILYYNKITRLDLQNTNRISFVNIEKFQRKMTAYIKQMLSDNFHEILDGHNQKRLLYWDLLSENEKSEMFAF